MQNHSSCVFAVCYSHSKYLLETKCLTHDSCGRHSVVRCSFLENTHSWAKASSSCRPMHFSVITSDKRGGKCVCPRSFVCLSVCLSVNKITQKHVLDLEFMLHVDRCRDMDELIKFWTRSGLSSSCWNRIAFSDIICAATQNFITSWKSHICVLARPVTAPRRGFKMVLFTASRGNTIVGGKCIVHSADCLLVLIVSVAAVCSAVLHYCCNAHTHTHKLCTYYFIDANF